jgi:hypothetical protein
MGPSSAEKRDAPLFSQCITSAIGVIYHIRPSCSALLCVRGKEIGGNYQWSPYSSLAGRRSAYDRPVPDLSKHKLICNSTKDKIK